jgi:hypothetical protein
MQKFFIHDQQGRVIGDIQASDPARAVAVFALRYGLQAHQLQARAVVPQPGQSGQAQPWAR